MRRHRNWPPAEQFNKPKGELGILEDVTMNDLCDNELFLIVQHDGKQHMGSMYFDDPKFCYHFHALLKANVGWPIKEIGDLDV
jgi:hypothetical protein